MENSSNNRSAQSKVTGINIYILGFALIATLIAGVAIGLLINRPTQSTQIVVTATSDPNKQPVTQTNEQQPAQASTQSNSAVATTGPENDPTAAGPSTPTIMDFVLSNARHFLGRPDAPVTLIEFSDFK